MPNIPIKFTTGINRRGGAPLSSPYDMEDCYIAPFDEVKAWREGSANHALTEKWVPRGKPWLKFNGRWFDADVQDSSFLFRNRAYISQIEGTDGSAEIFTSQLIKDITPIDDFYFQRFSRRLQDVPLQFGTYGLHNNANKTSIQYGTIFGTVRSWAADDTGIQGITVGKAVDYVFVPIDRYGQAGPWEFATILADVDTAGATNVTGTDIYTIVPEFLLGFALSTFWQKTGLVTEFGYDRIAIYRSIEYDLDGITVDPASTVSEFSPGGLFLEDISSDVIYQSKAYWPFDIQKDASTLTDQLGPVIDRSRNHWINRVNKRANNLAAKTSYLDRGVAIYGNVAYPTKFPQASMYINRATATVSGTFATGPDTITRGAGSWITDGFDIGDQVWVNGAATASNNKKLTITGLTATVMTVSETLVAEGPTSNVTVFNAPETVHAYTYVKPNDETVINNTGPPGYDLPRVTYGAYKTVVPYNGSETGVRTYAKYTPDIIGIDAAADTITIRGDWTQFFERFAAVGDQITVTGTASNDGVFDVAPSTTATNVTPETGGELSIDADAKTFTRSLGSWVTDGYTNGMVIALSAFSPNLGYYTITNVTATVLTLSEAPRATQEFVEGVPWAIGGRSISLSGGNTVLPVSQDITVGEGTIGNVEFYLLWENVSLDSNGRYVSKKQVPGQYYTFSGQLADDYDFYDVTDYDDAAILADLPVGDNVIHEDSRFYLSEVNAPWEITLEGGITPDAGEIIAITPSRIEESEQLTSYQFYIFTESTVYVAQRDGTSVSLTTVESTIGCKRGADNQPLVQPVLGGVVFYGTDNNLYFISGRIVQKLSYDIADIVDDGIDDLMYDAQNDYLYVKIAGSVGIYIYDFDRKMWIGQQRTSGSFDDAEFQAVFSGNIDETSIVGDQIGSTIFGQYYTIDQNDFEFYSEVSPTAGLRLVVKIDRVSPPGTDTVAVVEQPVLSSPGQAWTVISGDILSGDVTWDGGGEELYVEIDTLPGFLVQGGGEVRVRMRGIHENPAVPSSSSVSVRGLGYDNDLNIPVVSWNGTGEQDLALYEERDDSGALRFSPEIYTQEIDQITTQNMKEIRVAFDGQEFAQSSASWTVGNNTFTEGTGDDINGGLDSAGIIRLDGAGLDRSGFPEDLISIIQSEAAGTVTIADNIRSGAGGNITWWRPLDVRLFYLDAFRTRNIGWSSVIPNRPYYPKVGQNHRTRIGLRDFDVLRELLIFTDEFLDDD